MLTFYALQCMRLLRKIGTLGRKSDDFKEMMHERLMKIRSNEYNDFIFLGINEDGTGGHSFTFLIAYEEKDFITEFPACLKFHHGEKNQNISDSTCSRTLKGFIMGPRTGPFYQ